MTEYTVTFENGTVRDIPGSDLEDARQYAESCGPVASIYRKAKEPMACHYCGQPVYSMFGFFDEPACRECGGG